MTQLNFIASARRDRAIEAIKNDLQITESLATLVHDSNIHTSNILKLGDLNLIETSNGSFVKVEINEEFADMTSSSAFSNSVNSEKIDLKDITQESIQYALDSLTDLGFVSSRVSKNLGRVLNLLKVAGVLQSVGKLSESTAVCYINNKKFSITESDGGFSVGYTPIVGSYIPKRLTENTKEFNGPILDVVSSIQESLNANGYFTKIDSNLNSEDFSSIALHAIPSLKESSKLAVLVGEAYTRLNESHAFFEYDHPYFVNESFILAVDLESPNMVIGLTEEDGSVYITKTDKHSTGGVNESACGYTPLDEVNSLFLPGSKEVNEGLLISSFKDLLNFIK